MKPITRILCALSLAAFCAACGRGGGNGGGGANFFPAPLGSDSELINLILAGVELDQTFQSNMTDYTATVSLLKSTTTVTASLSDPNATMTVNGAAVGSGAPSDKITLVQGNNVITVEVTAEDGTTTTTYAIDVTRETAASFAQRAYVKASNTDEFDRFGNAVALSGDTLAVGANGEDSAATGIDGNQADDSSDAAGAVYVFTRDPAGVWSQQAYVKASNTDAGDTFGYSVALSGDTLAVGAIGEDSAATGIDGDQADNSAPNSGAVYVFTRDPAGVWSQQAYIKASNAESAEQNNFFGESFGSSIALSGDTLAVGAIGEDSAATGIDGDQTDNTATSAGAVYVFTRDPAGVWSQQAYVKASNTDAGDTFGYSVALSGDTMAVGARSEESAATGIDGDQNDNSVPGAGAVYIFTRDPADVWSQQAYVKASFIDVDVGDGFGHSVALSSDSLAVGAPFESSAATGIDGDQTDNSEGSAGAVYVFTRDSAAAWSQQAYVKASNAAVDGNFGESVALSGDTLAVGSNGESSQALFNGAAYIFTRDAASSWSEQAFFTASNAGGMDFFGSSVALSGDTVVLSAPEEDSAATGIDGDQSDNNADGSGAVYVIE